MGPLGRIWGSLGHLGSKELPRGNSLTLFWRLKLPKWSKNGSQKGTKEKQKSNVGPAESIRCHFGPILPPFWEPWASLGRPWGVLGRPWDVLVSTWPAVDPNMASKMEPRWRENGTESVPGAFWVRFCMSSFQWGIYSQNRRPWDVLGRLGASFSGNLRKHKQRECFFVCRDAAS